MASAPIRRTKPKIKPPRKPAPEFNADDTWDQLAKNIREIQNHNAIYLSFEENHRFGYNLVLYRHGEMLYNGLKSLVIENLHKLANEQIIPVFPNASGQDLMQQSQEAELLCKAVATVHEDHCSNMVKLGQILKYMDRVYTTSSNVPGTWDMGRQLFREHIMGPSIRDHLIKAILNQIRFEREGYMINRSAVKGSVEVFTSLYMDNDKATLYEEYLEPAILDESRAYYKAEGAKLLQLCDASAFLRRVEERYESEESRAHHYLSPRVTASLLRTILQEQLLSPHIQDVISLANSGLDVMVDSLKVEDLACLYRLCSGIATGLPCLKRALKNSITRQGKEINRLSIVVDEADEEQPGAEEGDAKRKGRIAKIKLANTGASKWVQEVLNLKDKFDTIWKTCWKCDREIESSMNEAFAGFVNLNDKAPEFISLFIDDHLRRGLKGKTDTEVDIVLDKTITVFRYISEKDVFERYYKNHLAKRLLHNRSVSDDAERGMLAKLKVECGFQFTQKLEGMFHDMKLSDDHMGHYRTYLEKLKSSPPEIEMSVIVMTSTFWPMSHEPPPCIFPPEMVQACNSYQRFYNTRHSGRRLTWMPSLGSADVKVRFKTRQYELNVSTFALVILLLFKNLSDGDKMSYADIKETTNIEDHELKRQLQSLACAKFKVLKKHPPGREVNDEDYFSFNEGFQSELHKIKIAVVAAKVESGEERKETRERIDEERKHQTDACVVRIMKDRKHMTHNELVNEVTRQLASRFQPDPLGIKKRIENLIEREYLERCDDRRSYNYLA